MRNDVTLSAVTNVDTFGPENMKADCKFHLKANMDWQMTFKNYRKTNTVPIRFVSHIFIRLVLLRSVCFINPAEAMTDSTFRTATYVCSSGRQEW